MRPKTAYLKPFIAVGAVLLIGMAWWQRSGRHPKAPPARATAPETFAPAPPDRTRPIAVMIDDHPDAWPQSGLSRAAIVWEAPVEGGLTRDMAVFRSASATEIGPVRSARPYFLLWAREADAVYAHVGGSDEALKDLSTRMYGLDDADEFSHGNSFWRDASRDAPHNTYSSTEKMRALMAAKSWHTETEATDPWRRDGATATGTPASAIEIASVAGGETISFRWNAARRGYDLSRRAPAVHDRSGEPVSPANVIVIEAKIIPIADPHAKGLIGIEAIGEGSATVFRDGVAIPAKWKKTSAASPTRFIDAQGREIALAPGQVWISVIGTNRSGSVTFRP